MTPGFLTVSLGTLFPSMRLQDTPFPYVSLAIFPWDPGSQVRDSSLLLLGDNTLLVLESVPPLCCPTVGTSGIIPMVLFLEV